MQLTDQLLTKLYDARQLNIHQASYKQQINLRQTLGVKLSL